DAFGAGFHRRFRRPLHAAAEAAALAQLFGNVFSNELGLDFRAIDFLDLDVDAATDELLQLGLQPLDLLAFASNDHARPGGVHRDFDFVAGPLDLDLGDTGEFISALD